MIFTRKMPIKLRLILSQWLITLVALTSLGLAAHYLFQLEESTKLDDFLMAEATSVRSTIEAFYQGDNFNGTLRPKDLENFLTDFMAKRANRAIPYKTTLAVFDPEKNLIRQSNQALDLVKTFNITAIKQKASDDLIIYSVPFASTPYRMVTAPLVFNRIEFGSIRLAILSSSLEDAVSSFTNSAILILVALALFLGILFVWITNMSLQPVRQMSKTVARISENNLSTRIPAPPGRDELHDLAKTFNELLMRLEADFKFQEDFINQLSHQLKTALTIFRARNERGLNQSSLDEPSKSILEDNLSDIDSIVAMLNTILNLARLENGVIKLHCSEVNLVVFLDSIIDELAPLWEEKNLRIEKLLSFGDPRAVDTAQFQASIDEVYFRQAIMNILTNAYKYAPVGSRITTGLERVINDGQRYWALTIANQGPLIPEDQLNNIFKKFFRIDLQDSHLEASDNDPHAKGFGLGLAIAKTLVELHHGTIRAYNNHRQEVCFEILLPVV